MPDDWEPDLAARRQIRLLGTLAGDPAAELRLHLQLWARHEPRAKVGHPGNSSCCQLETTTDEQYGHWHNLLRRAA